MYVWEMGAVINRMVMSSEFSANLITTDEIRRGVHASVCHLLALLDAWTGGRRPCS